jgi:CRP-like cAMP-binding protein
MREAVAIGMLERVLHLKRVPVFANLGSVELAALAQNTRERQFARGEALLREGEASVTIHFIVDGRVRMRRRGVDQGIAGPGAPVGGLGVLGRDEEGLDAVAETDTLVLSLERDAFVEVCEDHFALVHGVMAYLCAWFVDFQKKTWPLVAPHAPPPLDDPAAEPPGGLDLVERIFLLRRMPPFLGASINALAELSRSLTEVRLDSAVTLWHEGEPAHYVLLLVSGIVQCEIGGHPRGVRVGRGMALGPAEAIAERPRWYRAVTETPVVALQSPVEAVVDVFEDNFDMAMNYLTFLARLVISQMDRIGARSTLPDLLGLETT